MKGSRFMFGFFCGVFCALVLNSILLTLELRDQAIKHGHAEYYLDANHERQFRWKTNCVQMKEKS